MREYSIAVNSYERPDALRRLLASLMRGKWEFHSRVVVDDASSEKNFKEILKICKEYRFDLLKKRKRQFLGSSWNLGMIFCGTQHHLCIHDDMLIPETSKFLECMEKGFDAGHSIVSIFRTKVFCIDKALIPRIMWHDERYPFLRIEDGDFVLKAKETLGRNWCYNRHHGFAAEGELARHQAWGRKQGNRAWLDPREASLNLDFFFRKWEVDEKRIYEIRPEAENSPDYLGQSAYELNLVKRKMPEVDFYPKVTQRYLQGDFSSVPEEIERIAEIFRNGAS